MNKNVFVEWDTKQNISRKSQNNAINDVKRISNNSMISNWILSLSERSGIMKYEVLH